MICRAKATGVPAPEPECVARFLGEDAQCLCSFFPRSQVTDTVLAGLSDRISSARQSDQRAAAVRAAHDEELARTLAMVQQQQMSTGQSGTRSNYDRMGTDRISGGHDMDVDWQEDSGRVKKK